MLIIFYSGEENLGCPERVLGDKANVMLTYHTMQKKPHKRFRSIIKARKKKKGKPDAAPR